MPRDENCRYPDQTGLQTYFDDRDEKLIEPNRFRTDHNGSKRFNGTGSPRTDSDQIALPPTRFQPVPTGLQQSLGRNDFSVDRIQLSLTITTALEGLETRILVLARI
jgi:hypothetical protein